MNTSQTSVNLSAYQHWTDRENAINQTDFTYKVATGSVFHTIGFGTEFGRQTGIDLRNTGLFANGSALSPGVNPLNPTYFGPITFVHQLPGALSPGVSNPDSNSKYRLYTESGYARDQVDVTRWLQVIGGVRYDRFDMSAVDRNTGIGRARIDEKLSPQGAIIVKPMENLSVYGAYSISYLPASGDQFSSLNDGTLILQPQKFENTEVGVKWNVSPQAPVYGSDIQPESHQPAARRRQPSGLLPAFRQHKDPGI